MISGMDVWVQGWGLIALWVTAVAAVVTMLFVWSIWVSVQKSMRPGNANGPAQPVSGSSGASQAPTAGV